MEILTPVVLTTVTKNSRKIMRVVSKHFREEDQFLGWSLLCGCQVIRPLPPRWRPCLASSSASGVMLTGVVCEDTAVMAVSIGSGFRRSDMAEFAILCMMILKEGRDMYMCCESRSVGVPLNTLDYLAHLIATVEISQEIAFVLRL